MRRSPRFSREIRGIGFFNMQTLKLLTTSKRYHRLEKDLDINAGRLLEGVSLEQLVQEVDDFLLAGKVQGGRLPAPDGFAASLNLSVAYFNDLLAFELGKPFSIYIQFRQLELAKRLLVKGEGTAAEISVRLGFPSVQYFSFLFKKWTGVAPNDYRYSRN